MKIAQTSVVTLALIFLLTTPTPSISKKTITGKVIGISDGDTITILDSRKNAHKVRLYGIDSPERDQPFGNAAKTFISHLVATKIADVHIYESDSYGRSVGLVTVNGININQRLIDTGYAWQARQYCKASFCDSWIKAEQKARMDKSGLWRLEQPVSPWEWRKAKQVTALQ